MCLWQTGPEGDVLHISITDAANGGSMSSSEIAILNNRIIDVLSDVVITDAEIAVVHVEWLT